VLEVRGNRCRTKRFSMATTCWSRKTKTAHNGDIVVALIESTDATLKRFFREGREHTLAAFECGDEADHRAGGFGTDFRGG